MKRRPAVRVLGQKENFLGLEKQFSSYETSQIVVLSFPYEHTVSYGGGTGRGPKGLLDASHYVEFYDEELGTELSSRIGVATLPPLALGKSTGEKALQKMYEATKKVLADGNTPFPRRRSKRISNNTPISP
jgi:agmatinase